MLLYLKPYALSDRELVDRIGQKVKDSVKNYHLCLEIVEKYSPVKIVDRRLVVEEILEAYPGSFFVTSEKAYASFGAPTFGWARNTSILISTQGKPLSADNLLDLSLHEIGHLFNLPHHAYSGPGCSMIPFIWPENGTQMISEGKTGQDIIFEQLKTRTPGYCPSCISKLKPS